MHTNGTQFYTFYNLRFNASANAWERCDETRDAFKAFKWYSCGRDVEIVSTIDTHTYISERSRVVSKRAEKLGACKPWALANVEKLADVNAGRDKSIKGARYANDLKSARAHAANAEQAGERVERINHYYAFIKGVALGNTRDI